MKYNRTLENSKKGYVWRGKKVSSKIRVASKEETIGMNNKDN